MPQLPRGRIVPLPVEQHPEAPGGLKPLGLVQTSGPLFICWAVGMRLHPTSPNRFGDGTGYVGMEQTYYQALRSSPLLALSAGLLQRAMNGRRGPDSPQLKTQ